MEETIFQQYGFDVGISTKDSFSLICLEGILLLEVKKENGVELLARRIVTDVEGNTESFNVDRISKQQKEDLIRRLLLLEVSHSKISRLLGVSQSYVSNYTRRSK